MPCVHSMYSIHPEGQVDQYPFFNRNPSVLIHTSISAKWSPVKGVGGIPTTDLETIVCRNRPDFAGGSFTEASAAIGTKRREILLKYGKLMYDTNEANSLEPAVAEAHTTGFRLRSGGLAAAHVDFFALSNDPSAFVKLTDGHPCK
ncbi:hypothetical protein QCA50_019766 [Cerrena zonata]|uniref:Uncharacterized protein n=1 Tax=Cerrena zonata TaxID=2478898 RepID=A0AAW0F8L8_9APHY